MNLQVLVQLNLQTQVGIIVRENGGKEKGNEQRTFKYVPEIEKHQNIE